MKKLLFIIIILNSICADTINPYTYKITYDKDSTKDSETGYGVYGNYILNSFFIDYGLSTLKRDYKKNNKITQNDITLVYNQYLGKDILSRVGIHYINSDDKNIDKGKIFILGIKQFDNKNYNIGIDFYYSSYSNLSDLTIMQFSPFAGFYFKTDYVSGDFYFKSVYNIIAPQKTDLGISKNRYFNFSLSNIYGNTTSTLSVNAFGTEQFSINNGGLFATTQKESYKNTLGLSLEYKISNSFSVKAKAKIFDFRDEDNNNQAIKKLYSLSLNISF